MMTFSRRRFLALLSISFLAFYGVFARARPLRLKPKKIIVIGAGISGLACARALTDAGHKVTVLEARARIGGRTHTEKIDSLDIELGAAWIHGIQNNPLYELVRKMGLKTIPTDYFSPADTFNSAGEIYTKEARKKINSTFSKVREALFKARAKLNGGDLPLQAAFEEALLELKLKPIEKIEQLHLLQTEIENEYAADASRLSLRAWDSLDEFEGAQVQLAGGYKRVAEGLTKGIDIKLNSEVSSVTYRQDVVRVVSASGAEYTADKVVVTLPLGVLKGGSVKFSPPLPERKLAALNRLEMGLFNKVFLKFSIPFWGKSSTWIEYMAGKKDAWPMFLNLHAVENQPILCAFVVGSFAVEMESKTDGEIQNQIMSQLRIMYGSDIPDPEIIRVTRWRSDPFAKGSYSFIPVGGSAQDLAVLGESVNNLLFFAGEHTSSRHQATVHAAYITGLEAAGLINKVIESESLA